MLGTTYKKALPGWTTKSFEGEAYYLINSKQELEKKWPFILSQKPGFIKFYLIFSEEYERRKDDTVFNGKKGIDPNLAKLIVKKAHAAGLQVSAHAETPADLRAALDAGVDEINHLPGYQVRWRDGYSMHNHVGDVTVNENFTWIGLCNFIRWYTAVAATNP